MGDGAGELTHHVFFQGYEFSYQNPLGSSQPSVTPVSGDLMPSSGLIGTLHTCGEQIYNQDKHQYTLNEK